MAIRCYLAMTAGEMAAAAQMPPYPAWMACHFSCYGTGLSNLPQGLPEGSIIILNDRTPVQGHDPDTVVAQLEQLDLQLKPKYYLLDLQRESNPQTEKIVCAVTQAFGQRVGVTEHYAANRDCPVFVSACPLRVPLEKHLAKWSGRELWLEAALEAETVTVDAHGCRREAAFLPITEEPTFFDQNLCCRYHTQVLTHRAVFSVGRGKAELEALLEKAAGLGVTLAVGLYQQLGAENCHAAPQAKNPPSDTDSSLSDSSE